MLLNLSNKYFFFLTTLFFVTILTGINNYYFYEHVERSAYRDANQLKLLIEQSKNFCVENNVSYQICEKNIVSICRTFEKQSHYNTNFVIIDSTGSVVSIKEKIHSENFYDQVAGSNIQLHLPQANYLKEINLTYNIYLDTNQFIESVFKSMTFSISDMFIVTYEKGLKIAITNFQKHYWYRSRPMIGFTIFSVLILLVYRQRIKSLENEKIKNEKKLYDQFKNDLDNELDKLKKENKIIDINHLRKYESLINEPNKLVNFDDLNNTNPVSIGNQFRKVLEKIIIPISSKIIDEPIDNLNYAINILKTNTKISSVTINYAHIIRVYGNIDSHYNNEHNSSKEEIIILSNYLYRILEELEKLPNIITNQAIIEPIKTIKFYDKIEKKFKYK